MASYVVLPTSGPPGPCMCCPFFVIINCDGRGHGCWLLFLFLKLFWVFFAGPSCVSQIDILCCSLRVARISKRCHHDWRLLLKTVEWAFFWSYLCGAAASGSIAAKFRVHVALLSWGKTNRDIGQDAVFLTLREVG